MSTLQKIIPHYTVEDWQHWDGAWELIDGHPIAMSPAPIPLHQRVASEMQTEIVLALRKAKCKKCRAYHPIDYVINEDTVVIPDILVISGDIKKKYLDFSPALVVEIVSPSSVLRDRNTKHQIYESQGVKFYLIVDAERQTIDVFELIEGKLQLRQNGAHQFQLEEDCHIHPDFSAIFDSE